MSLTSKIAVIPSLHRDPQRLRELLSSFTAAGIEPRLVVTGKRLDDELTALDIDHRSPRDNPGFGASIESACDGDWEWLFISNDDVEIHAEGLASIVADLDALDPRSDVLSFLDPGLRRAAPTPWTVFRSIALWDAVLRSRASDADPQAGPWYKSFSLVVVSRGLWDALDAFDDRLPYTYEDADFAVRAWQRGATLRDTSVSVAVHHGSETSRRVASGVLPVSTYSACRYLEARGFPLVRARALVVAALVARLAMVPVSSVGRRDHLKAIRRSIGSVTRWKSPPRLPGYEVS